MRIPFREFKTAEAARRFEKRKVAEGFQTLYVFHSMKRYKVKFWKETNNA